MTLTRWRSYGRLAFSSKQPFYVYLCICTPHEDGRSEFLAARQSVGGGGGGTLRDFNLSISGRSEANFCVRSFRNRENINNRIWITIKTQEGKNTEKNINSTTREGENKIKIVERTANTPKKQIVWIKSGKGEIALQEKWMILQKLSIYRGVGEISLKCKKNCLRDIKVETSDVTDFCFLLYLVFIPNPLRNEYN